MNIWEERIGEMLEYHPGNIGKQKYLISVLMQIWDRPEYFPTEYQKTLLRRFWAGYQKKKARELESITGYPVCICDD